AHRGLVHQRARKGVAQRALAVGLLAGGGVAERDVRVERRMLEAGRRLDGGDDLPGHAELGEAAERGLLVRPEVAYGLVETDQPLLDQILRVAAREEVRARLQPDEARVTAHEDVQRAAVAVPRPKHELEILELSLGLLRCGRGPCGHRIPRVRWVSRRPALRRLRRSLTLRLRPR